MTDQVVFSTSPGQIGLLPAEESFAPGDIVEFKSTNQIGMVLNKFRRDVKYSGFLGIQIVELDFYTVFWFNGTIRTAGAHQSHQMKRLFTAAEWKQKLEESGSENEERRSRFSQLSPGVGDREGDI